MSAAVANKWWFGEKRVLLVEDNDLVHDLVRAIMERVGIEIDICINGADAVQAVQDKDYDVVLMDIQMPVMDGLQATQEIRQLGGTLRELPIIAMSANSCAEDVKVGHKAGMNAYLGKPIDKELLYQTLSRYLDNLANDAENGIAEEQHEYTDFPALAHIDTRDGLQRMAGNINAYRLMLKNFQQKYLTANSELASCLRQGDFATAIHLSHNVKGNAGNLGAKALHLLASDLERACREGNLVMANSLLAEFQPELDAVIRSIDSVATDTAPQPEQNITFNQEIWTTHCKDYIKLLDTDYAAAMDGLDQLKRSAANMYSEQMLLLEQSINGFDVDSAREILESIQISETNPGTGVRENE